MISWVILMAATSGPMPLMLATLMFLLVSPMSTLRVMTSSSTDN